MASYNKVILMGNITRDPELRQTQGGTSVVKFTVAINDKIKDKDTTSFIDCTAFGKTAENIAKYFHKGSPILIEGRLRQESWTDKQSGQNRSKLVIVADKFEFVGGAKSECEQISEQERKDDRQTQRDFIDERKQRGMQCESFDELENDDVPF